MPCIRQPGTGFPETGWLQISWTGSFPGAPASHACEDLRKICDDRFMKYSVLIVDDEYLIRQGVEFMIDWEKEGFTIIGKAANGREALELAQSRHPDLVISDIVMPEMDGMELTSRLQEICPDTQVIVLSSYSEFDYVRNTLTHGAADYILKPALSPATLLESLQKIRGRLSRQDHDTADAVTALNRILAGYETEVPDSLQNRSWILAAGSSDSVSSSAELFCRRLPSLLAGRDVIVLNPQDRQYALLIENPDQDLENLKESLKTVKAPDFVLLSAPLTELTALRQVYAEPYGIRTRNPHPSARTIPLY